MFSQEKYQYFLVEKKKKNVLSEAMVKENETYQNKRSMKIGMKLNSNSLMI